MIYYKPMLSSKLKSIFILVVGGCFHALAQAPNVLSESERALGWQLMFDGKVLDGWHSFKKTDIQGNGWIIKDSSIYLKGTIAGSLLAPPKFIYRNFEITIDWKIPETGNSGIFLRYLEDASSENFRTGPETQVCGKGHLDYKAGISITSPGACYGMYAPAQPWIKDAEEFNTFHIIMYEDKVAHFGNGIRLLEYQIGSADWKAKYDLSKYNSFPLYGDIHAGKLFLQNHASPVWYRNIKIRPLTEDPWLTPGFIWPDQTMGIQTLNRKSRTSLSKQLSIGLYRRNMDSFINRDSNQKDTNSTSLSSRLDIRNLQGRKVYLTYPGY